MKAHQNSSRIPAEATEEIIIELEDNEKCRLDGIAADSGVTLDTLATALVKLFLQEATFKSQVQGN